VDECTAKGAAAQDVATHGVEWLAHTNDNFAFRPDIVPLDGGLLKKWKRNSHYSTESQSVEYQKQQKRRKKRIRKKEPMTEEMYRFRVPENSPNDASTSASSLVRLKVRQEEPTSDRCDTTLTVCDTTLTAACDTSVTSPACDTDATVTGSQLDTVATSTDAAPARPRNKH